MRLFIEIAAGALAALSLLCTALGAYRGRDALRYGGALCFCLAAAGGLMARLSWESLLLLALANGAASQIRPGQKRGRGREL